MNLIKAIKLVSDGRAEEHLNRFIGLVKYAVATGEPVGFDIDDALVVSVVLQRLSESAEGRKILGLKKRKNTQYKARDFKAGSPQWNIADDYCAGKLNKGQAVKNMAESFIDPPDDRTVSRLLEELATDIQQLRKSTDAELSVISSKCGSRDEALRQMFDNIAGPGALEKVLRGINESTETDDRKAVLKNQIEMLMSAGVRNKN